MEGFNGCFLTNAFRIYELSPLFLHKNLVGWWGFRSSARGVICGGRGSVKLTCKVGDEVLVDFLSVYGGFENIGVGLSWFLCCMLEWVNFFFGSLLTDKF